MSAKGKLRVNNLSFLGSTGTEVFKMSVSDNVGEATFSHSEGGGSVSIKNISDPIDNQDAATKSYVDGIATAGASWKNSVTAASTVEIDGNGVGVWPPIDGVTTVSIIDGVTLATSDRVLIKNQGDTVGSSVDNGIWQVTEDTWIRSTDLPVDNLAAGAAMFINEGIINGDKGYICINDDTNDIVGTSSLSFTNFSSAPAVSGSDTQIQYNKNGIFGADSNFTWDDTAQLFTATGTSSTADVLNLTGNLNMPELSQLILGDGVDQLTFKRNVGNCQIHNNQGETQINGSGAQGTFLTNGFNGSGTSGGGMLRLDNRIAGQPINMKLGDSDGSASVNFQNSGNKEGLIMTSDLSTTFNLDGETSNSVFTVKTTSTDQTTTLTDLFTIDALTSSTGLATFNTGSDVLLVDDVELRIGTGNDLIVTHDATDSFITSTTGSLNIVNSNASGDTIFKLGDAVGATNVLVKDSADATVFTIDSNGAMISNKIEQLSNDFYIASTATGITDAQGLAVHGDYLYITSPSVDRVYIYKTDPFNDTVPALIGSITDATNLDTVTKVIHNGNTVFVGGSTNTNTGGFITSIDMTDPVAPVIISKKNHNNVQGVAGMVQIGGGHIMLGSLASHITIAFNVADPSNMIGERLTNAIGTGVYGMEVIDDKMYICAGNTLTSYYIIYYDTIDLQTIQSYTVTGLTSARDLKVQGNYAYISSYNAISGANGITVVDISKPNAMLKVGTIFTGDPIDTLGLISDMAISGKYLYVIGEENDDLQRIDISDPTALVGAGRITGFNDPTSLEISGSYLYVTNRTGNSVIKVNIGSAQLPQLSCGNIRSTTSVIEKNSTIQGNLNVGSGISVRGSITSQGPISTSGAFSIKGSAQFYGTASAATFIDVKAADTVTTHTLTLPGAQATSGGQVLADTAGDGVLAWSDIATGTVSGAIQYKSGTNLDATDTFLFTASPNTLQISDDTSGFISGLAIPTNSDHAATKGYADTILPSDLIANYTEQTAAEANTWRDVTYGNGTYVAVSDGGTNQVMTSPDGITWTSRTAAEAVGWYRVAYGNGLFVAVSSSGDEVMTSPDGITWTSRTPAVSVSWRGVAYVNNLFIATGTTGGIMTSPDGISWTDRTTGTGNNWLSTSYNDGIYVIVGGFGTDRLLTSTDAITWTQRTPPDDNSWNSVTFGNGLFVAVSHSGTDRVMTSPDGINWTRRTSAEQNAWSSVKFNNGLFVAVSSSGTNMIMTSSDGITWTSFVETYTGGFWSITYGPSGYVSTGSGGLVATFVYSPGNLVPIVRNGFTISLNANTDLGADIDLVLPSLLGSAGQVLTDPAGDGNLEWSTVAAGTDTHIQFNSGGTTLTGSGDLTWDDSTKLLSVTSTSATADALTITGNLNMPELSQLILGDGVDQLTFKRNVGNCQIHNNQGETQINGSGSQGTFITNGFTGGGIAGGGMLRLDNRIVGQPINLKLGDSDGSASVNFQNSGNKEGLIMTSDLSTTFNLDGETANSVFTVKTTSTDQTTTLTDLFTIDALTSSTGLATFNTGSDVLLVDDVELRIGTGNDLIVTHDATDSFITSTTGALNIVNSNASGDTVFKMGDAAAGTNVLFTDNADASVMTVTSDRTVESVSTTTGAVQIVGGLGVTLSVSATEFNATSDATLKTEINPLNNSLATLNKVEGYSYKWLKDEGTGKEMWGVLAQQLETVGLGHMVTNGGEHKAVNYLQLIPLIIESVKELNKKLDLLNK